MYMTATESFWTLVQRLVRSFKVRRSATQGLEYSSSIGAVVQYRPNERMTNFRVDFPEMGSLTVTSVPISFVEIDHEIFSTVILSLPLIQEGQLSVSGERMCTILVNRLEDKACPVNVWLGKLTVLDMTPLG